MFTGTLYSKYNIAKTHHDRLHDNAGGIPPGLGAVERGAIDGAAVVGALRIGVEGVLLTA